MLGCSVLEALDARLLSGVMQARGVRPTSACSRLALRAVFQSYFRVVIAVRGVSAVRRNRQAAEARRRSIVVARRIVE